MVAGYAGYGAACFFLDTNVTHIKKVKLENMYSSLADFISRQEELLKIEHDEEVQERTTAIETLSLKELEKRGICLRNLKVCDQRTGMYGRFLVTYGANGGVKTSLSSHKFSSGGIVGVYSNKADTKSEPIASGVVSRTKAHAIVIAFDDEFDVNTYPLYRLMLMTNDVTHRRLKATLNMLEKIAPGDNCYPLVENLFPCKIMHDSNQTDEQVMEFFNASLDESQKDAVRFVLTTKNVISVIHGPPGTGKSTTVIEVIRQAVKLRNMKVLVCAPSNIAVDNLVEKLAQTNLRVVRLGHPARSIREAQKHSLDAILTSRDESDIILSVRKEISMTVGKFKSTKSDKGKINSLRQEVKELKKELSRRETKLMREVLEHADVVLSTTTSASEGGPLKHLPNRHFDLLVIDEAAQALEVSCWIPMLKVSRCVLAGDHLQLPPTIISEKAAKKGLSVTLLERVVKGCGENAVKMLTTQYRMHEKIMQWPSGKMYQGKLQAAMKVANHLLKDLPGVTENEFTLAPLMFADTSGNHFYEVEEGEDQSQGNVHEVELISEHVKDLVNSGVQQSWIGVITPYNLQVELLRQAIHPTYPNIEINSVDGFQGREKEAILISFVRSNDSGVIGFLSEDRRTNVAITRARRHLFIVGNSLTISHNTFLESLCSFLHENSELKIVADGITSAGSHSVIHLKDMSLEKECEIVLRNGNKNQSKYSNTKKKTDKSEAKKEEKKYCIRKGKDKEDYPSKTESSVLEDKFRIRIESFLNSEEVLYEFPASLTSRERAIVHELGEEFQLVHKSMGEGKERKIVISKVKEQEIKEESSCNAKFNSEVLRSELDTEILSTKAVNNVTKSTCKDGDGSVLCDKCNTKVPLNNYQLHLGRCRSIKTPIKQNSSSQTLNNSTKKKKKKRETSVKAEIDDDFDSIIDTFVKETSHCGFAKCKASIKTLGQKCQFCQRMFCLSHHMAEIHGCGKEAKIKARQDIAKYGANMPKKMNETKKTQVQKKLNNKIEGLEDSRKKKIKPEKK